MTDLDLAHLVVVTYDNHCPTTEFRAECSCGWTGDGHDDNALAELDADDHRDLAVDQGDDLDRSISELLDLQDDLAAVVMWLAEHWPADLPAPAPGPHAGDGARVMLWAYCTDTADLDRAAGLLGVPVLDDNGPDSRGNRYRRAVRQFGRVQVEVFRALDHDQVAA